jgi:hypothetical protein
MPRQGSERLNMTAEPSKGKPFALCPVCKTLVPWDEATRTFLPHGKANREPLDCPNAGQPLPTYDHIKPAE